MDDIAKHTGPTRRHVLRAAAGTAATVAGAGVLGQAPARAAEAAEPLAGGPVAGKFPRIDERLMLTPSTALDWADFKSRGGPTYAGTPGGLRYTQFLREQAEQMGLIDIDTVDVPYPFYTVEDWPDRATHIYGSGKEVEKLVSDGTPVPVVASYGMTSGSTGPDGITAQMLFYDPQHPPTKDEIAGKILVFQTAKQPDPPYSDSFLDSYTMTDYEYRSPGEWWPLYTPPPASVTSSYKTRWEWNQVGGFARIGIAGGAAGMVVVYDLSPAAAFGLVQRSVYTADGEAGPGATFVNCPTLCLDRVNGAKVLRDAKAGKTAELTLIASFKEVTATEIVGYLPGRHYGTPDDKQIIISTHTDAMSLVEDDGGLGMLGILHYFHQIPQSQRPRTLVFYFDCRHFMPGGESAWEQYDYYVLHPEKLEPIIASMGIEHMGARQTIEVGTGGNTYTYSPKGWNAGGVITSLIDIYNNNPWLIRKVAQAATDTGWPRVDAKCGDVEPGVNGGFQGRVKSPLNKGRTYGFAGIGLAGDWPGAATQTYAQLDTEAGPHGFDEHYFVRQVAGLSQIAGELMLVEPIVIDLVWGNIKSALLDLADAAFTDPAQATSQRGRLITEYSAVFQQVESGHFEQAKKKLAGLTANVRAWVEPSEQQRLVALLDGQKAKLDNRSGHGH
jgi:hypothetical protein